MIRKISGSDEILARYYNVIIPEAEREYFSIVKSTVDVSVWLVGLSTGVIALLMSSNSIRDLLGQNIFNTGIILFSLVIIFGVLQRILFHIAELKRWPLSLRLRGCLVGLTDKTLTAQELRDFWTVNDIVEHLREDFGLDYSFLLKYSTTLEDARNAYNSQMEIHKKYEQKGLTQLAEIICAHYGLPKEAEENYFKPQDLNTIRMEAQVAGKIYKASFISYYTSAFFFVIGIISLIYGAI